MVPNWSLTGTKAHLTGGWKRCWGNLDPFNDMKTVSSNFIIIIIEEAELGQTFAERKKRTDVLKIVLLCRSRTPNTFNWLVAVWVQRQSIRPTIHLSICPTIHLSIRFVLLHRKTHTLKWRTHPNILRCESNKCFSWKMIRSGCGEPMLTTKYGGREEESSRKHKHQIIKSPSTYRARPQVNDLMLSAGIP